MDSAEMVRRMLQSRRQWHELDNPPRRALLLQRPPEISMLQWRTGTTMERIAELVLQAIVDWRGFTEADLLGASLGSSDEQPFSAEVLSLWAMDNATVLTEAATKIFEMIKARDEAVRTIEKN